MKPRYPQNRSQGARRSLAPTEIFLKDQTFLLTRDPEENALLAKRLTALGGSAISWPSYTYEAVADGLKTLPGQVQTGRYDWIVFTSARAVSFFFKAFADGELAPSALSGSKIAAVGARTAQSLRDQGFEVQLVPEDKSSAGLSNSVEFVGTQGLRILLPCAADAREEFVESVQGRHHVDNVVIYRKRPFQHTEQDLAALAKKRIDWIVFYSPSAVDALRASLPDEVGRALLSRARFAVIGHTTEQHLARLGYKVDVVARGASTEALLAQVQELTSQFRRTPHNASRRFPRRNGRVFGSNRE